MILIAIASKQTMPISKIVYTHISTSRG